MNVCDILDLSVFNHNRGVARDNFSLAKNYDDIEENLTLYFSLTEMEIVLQQRKSLRKNEELSSSMKFNLKQET